MSQRRRRAALLTFLSHAILLSIAILSTSAAIALAQQGIFDAGPMRIETLGSDAEIINVEGDGTLGDPFLIELDIKGPHAVLQVSSVLEVEEHIPRDAQGRGHEHGFRVKLIAFNKQPVPWSGLEIELQPSLGASSDEADGLSFFDGRNDLRHHFYASRFAQRVSESGERDAVVFYDGLVEPEGDTIVSALIGQSSPEVHALQHPGDPDRLYLIVRPAAPPPPQPLFLPIAIRDSRCPPKDIFLDVALVLDASTSMNQPTAQGRSKSDVALEAARAFVDGLRFSEGPRTDRLGIYAFNEVGITVQEFSSDVPVLREALRAYPPRTAQSRLDDGLLRALSSLETHERSSVGVFYRGVIIVLSDGLLTFASHEDVVTLARAAKRQSVVIYAVGVGPEIDDRLLRTVATDEGRYLEVVDPEGLVEVFRNLSHKIPCDAEVFWPLRR